MDTLFDDTLEEALKAQKHAAWALLRQEKVISDPLRAGRCLEAALFCKPRLFRAVLEKCMPGEYGAKTVIHLENGCTAVVEGTLLTVAAALNKEKHVAILLKAGYDPNAAGPSAAGAFDRGDYTTLDDPAACGGPCGVGKNQVLLSGRRRWELYHMTPLGAAVACGSTKAAQVLMKDRRVWRGESGAVCRAVMSALRTFGPEDPRQAAAGVVFGISPRRFTSEELLRDYDLQIQCSADFCTAADLRTQLEGGFCTEERARKLLDLLAENTPYRTFYVCARLSKLRLMEQYFPALCREPSNVGALLRELVRRWSPEHPHQALMKRWKDLSGAEGDLTWAAEKLLDRPPKEARELLDRLGEGMELVMDADAYFFHLPRGTMLELLRHVRLRHNRGLEGVSHTAFHLVRSCGTREFLAAMKLGALDGEDSAALLSCMDEFGKAGLRMAVLARGGQNWEDGPQPWERENRGNRWRRCWCPKEKAYAAWLCQLTDEPLEAREVLRRLHTLSAPPCAHSDFWDWAIDLPLTGNPRRDHVHLKRPEAAIFCAGQSLPAKVVMEHMPQKLLCRYEVKFDEMFAPELLGTPLCLAAATGRTGTVKLLLDSGIHPDELGRGECSILAGYMRSIAVTPLMAALYYGEEETAKLLYERGAVCDTGGVCFSQLLMVGGQELLERTERLLGRSIMTAEQLEALQYEQAVEP